MGRSYPRRYTLGATQGERINTQALTRESFEPTVTSYDIVFVDFRAWWCGSCRMFARSRGRGQEARPHRPGDTEAEQARAAAAQVTPLPSRRGSVSASSSSDSRSALPVAVLGEVVDGVRAPDMIDGRAQLAGQPQSATA